MDPADDEPAIAMLRAWYYKLDPFFGGYYDNIYFDGAEAAGNYGPAYERLQKIKGQYDPTNLFRLNSNIEPVAEISLQINGARETRYLVIPRQSRSAN